MSTSAQDWLNIISAARKRESKSYREKAQQIVRLYEAEKASSRDDISSTPFNILYSNTETLAPALYNRLPIPEVNRRFRDKDLQGKLASQIVERTLSYSLDNDLTGYDTFDSAMQTALTESLVAGRGIIRFKYDMVPSGTSSEIHLQSGEQGSLESGETVCCEVVHWDCFLHGYARRWSQVPWVAFEHRMTKEELESNFGEDKVEGVNESSLEDRERSGESYLDPTTGKDESGESNDNFHTVYEIWDKSQRKVLFVSPCLPDSFLKEVDDPLGLTAFFPIAKPLSFFDRISSLTPVPLYVFYEDQAKELNHITQRIRRIILAMKVRGFYDSTIVGIENLLTADDNTFLPAQNVAALQQGQSMEKSLFLMPIEKLITVLQQLYAQRNQVKQVIYDITGIADIMRGSTKASETLGAQELKSQWGTMRLKKLQREVARFVRDNLRIMAEISVSKFSPETLLAITGLPILTNAQKQNILIQHQTVVMQAMMVGQPPPPSPDLGPTIEDLQALLQNDLFRGFSIDIETNSTLELEASQDKQETAELMNAVAQFMNGVAPAVQAGVLPFDAAKAMLLAIVRRLRFGKVVEDELEKMQAPQAPQPQGPQEGSGKSSSPSPEAAQMELQSAALKAQVDTQKAQAEALKLQQEMELRGLEHEVTMAELQRKQALSEAKFQVDLQQIRTKAAIDAEKSTGITSE